MRDKLFEHKFKVRPSTEGRHYPFPVDMLRYDGCYPASEYFACRIQQSFPPAREYPGEVELIARNSQPRWQPTLGRWESFGWTVVGQAECVR